MSYFGTALRAKIESRDMMFADVANIANLSPGFISQICSNRQSNITKTTVEAILDAFKIEDALELAIAHLHDEVPHQTTERIRITAADLREYLGNYFIQRLDDSFENAVQRIRSAVPHNEDLRLLVIDLANATCGRDTSKPEKPTPKKSNRKTLHPHDKLTRREKN